MTDKPPKPPTPEVLEPELVPETAPAKRPRGNPNMVKGGPSTHPGGYPKEARAFNEQFRALGPKALERIEEILDNTDGDYDPEYVGNIARWCIERGFGKAVPMSHDDPAGQGGTETRTMTVTFVTPKKDG